MIKFIKQIYNNSIRKKKLIEITAEMPASSDPDDDNDMPTPHIHHESTWKLTKCRYMLEINSSKDDGIDDPNYRQFLINLIDRIIKNRELMNNELIEEYRKFI